MLANTLTEMLVPKKDIVDLLNKEILQENMELKKELETLNIKYATSEIRDVFNSDYGFYGYLGDYVDYLKTEDSENESFIEYTGTSSVYKKYVNLCKQYGFELVDKVIEDMVDEKRKEMESE